MTAVARNPALISWYSGQTKSLMLDAQFMIRNTRIGILDMRFEMLKMGFWMRDTYYEKRKT